MLTDNKIYVRNYGLRWPTNEGAELQRQGFQMCVTTHIPRDGTSYQEPGATVVIGESPLRYLFTPMRSWSVYRFAHFYCCRQAT
jgi:hypothetical protein